MHRYVIFAIILSGIFSIANAEELKLGTAPESKSVVIGKQVQIEADLRNAQDIEQDFAYIVQIQDENGITVSLGWITGTLTPAQTFTPSLSWIPSEAGTFKATIFVWESIDNPSALSPTLSLDINVGAAA